MSEQRARQLQALASDLANNTDTELMLDLGQRALDAAFGGPNALVLSNDTHELMDATDLPDAVRDGLRCCMREGAVLGPGTGRLAQAGRLVSAAG